MEVYRPTPQQEEYAKRNESKELAEGSHPNTFSEQRNIYIAQGSGTIAIGDSEEVIQPGYVYMFKQGETVEFRVKEKLVVYFA